ncbi:hypothetical protein SS50377_22861 [Spironucleus salmonicida]|uniref:Uncharacterized protein n=1 Tax=Spironucleus salmonicida TaxID=348837 RepID=V6LVR1_9EUKA|nr:hypothetical protein SS50377_22858 [Spironucleus salmonicida]KAH0575234.1 hypothetical protein SS50377_22861 [Spironucleus salmonicida]|eukprot:EST48709.1 Hypothetical protein SS50377_jh025 [Spironucleus salmonicida]
MNHITTRNIALFLHMYFDDIPLKDIYDLVYGLLIHGGLVPESLVCCLPLFVRIFESNHQIDDYESTITAVLSLTNKMIVDAPSRLYKFVKDPHQVKVEENKILIMLDYKVYFDDVSYRDSYFKLKNLQQSMTPETSL